MTKQAFSVEEMRRRTEVAVDRGWNERILRRVERRIRRGRLAARATLGAAALLAIGAGAWWRLAPGAPELASAPATRPLPGPAAPAGTPEPATTLRFDDGATGQLEAPGSRARVTERSPARTTVEVSAGAIGFEVAHTGREFRVQAGPVLVTVVGTAFTVERQAAGVRVSVRRGRVKTEIGGHSATLDAGQQRWFATPAAPLAPPEPPAPERASAPVPARAAAGGASTRRATARWRLLAQRGDFKRAYQLLGQPGENPRDDVEELLLAADVARRSNHFAEAVPYYDRVIARYDGDPRAALAAMSKARIVLYQLGRPQEAASAFAQARALSLPDSLAEDALVGEVTAWHRAGQPARARAAAEEYLRRYPAGSALASVKKLGGLP